MIKTEAIKEEGFQKNDKDKLQWEVLPIDQLEGVVRVLTHGGKKYGRENYLKCAEGDEGRFWSAMMRHLVCHQKYNNSCYPFPHDPESQLLHIDHALSSLLIYRFLLHRNCKIHKRNYKDYE